MQLVKECGVWVCLPRTYGGVKGRTWDRQVGNNACTYLYAVSFDRKVMTISAGMYGKGM